MIGSAVVARRFRIAGTVIVGGVIVTLLVALLLLSYGWNLLRPMAERRASAALGRTVTIAAIRRVGGGLFHPLLAFEGVRVAQPAWAGSGDLVRLRLARVRIAALPLLAGKLDPEDVVIDGLRASLIRSRTGRANWDDQGAERDSGIPRPDLGQFVVRDAIISIEDLKHQHRFVVRVSVDAHGLRVAGSGSVSGSPATIAILAPPVRGSAPWPFRAEVASAAVTLRAQGRMRAPLDLDHFTAHVQSSGRSLVDLDRLIEAGLPATQRFSLAATIERDRPAWIITQLAGTIGRSDLAGALTIRKRGERTQLQGQLVSNGFDFDDLASDEQLARAAAVDRRIGPRLFPSTRIRLDALRRLDGTLRIDFRRLLARQPTVFRSLSGVLTLDHGVLSVSPITAGLVAGSLSGSLVVRHPAGVPLLVADLRLSNSRVERIVHTAGVLTGPLIGRLRLQGHGSTVREAAGNADGRIALVVPNGTMTRRVALFLGADVGRGLFSGDSERTELRCVVGSFSVRDGIARPDPLIFDSPIARADGTGSIDLKNETVAIDLHGTPKKEDALRLNGPIEARGTLEKPTFNPPPQTKTVGGILRMVGKALGGHREPLAADANCSALEASALR